MDRRTLGAVYAASLAVLLGIAWIGSIGAGLVSVTPTVAKASFSIVVAVLATIDLWLLWDFLSERSARRRDTPRDAAPSVGSAASREQG